MNRIYLLLLVFTFLSINGIFAQQVVTHQFSLEWSEASPLKFKDSGELSSDPRLPVYTFRIPVSGKSTVEPQLLVASSEIFDLSAYQPALLLPQNYIIGAVSENNRGKWYVRVWLMPIVAHGATQAEKIISGEIILNIQTSIAQRSGPGFKTNSVLASGTIHKIKVDKSGIYKLDYNFIKDNLNIDPATLAPEQIAVFGNGDGRMPQWSATTRIDDLEETKTRGIGMEDGRIDQGDYFLWYAQGPDQWKFSTTEKIYHMDKNPYDDFNNYYIIINGPTRQSMATRPNETNGDYESVSSLVYQRLEDQKVNLLGRYRTPGSGQEWYGDELAAIDHVDYTNRFNFQDMVAADSVYYKARFAVRSGSTTRFYVNIGNREFNRIIGSVDLGEFESSFANDGILQGSFVSSDGINNISIDYPDANGINSRAWIDYIELNVWKNNNYRAGTPLFIRDPRSLYAGVPTYMISNLPAGSEIWDITNPLAPVVQQYNSGTLTSFTSDNAAGNIPNEFIAFNPNSDLLIPKYTGVVNNQNLHSTSRADLVIIYYDAFETAALKLADHRRTHSGLEVKTIPVSQLFEEFSGGSKDPTAIRDFARMLYTRDPQFQYLLLFGDATYDYLHRTAELPDHNFVPAFETEESLDPIYSFPSDDYFALLDEDEGADLAGAIDIAIGRLPVSTADEAMNLVDKIIYYDTNPATLNDWRQRVVIVADDEDGNLHVNQADGLATKVSLEHPELNTYKIYLDAYPQESTPGGDRYPDVNDELDLHMKKGALTVTYVGHGGQNGWSQERVLGINQAQSYENINNMPLFITATCSFAGYDEPGFTTAGEHLLTNPKGGAIALMTTVRAVYSGSNERLTNAVLEKIYDPDQPGEYPSISEVLRRAKNNGIDSIDRNARKFTLLGDPSMKLAFPKYNVGVTSINGNPVGGSILDTLSALEKATLSGVIMDANDEVMSNFNGRISLTVFDKMQHRKTLANDERSAVRSFNVQNKQLFKGSATVENGEWTIEFVLPKDIDYSYGLGKMSFYAHDNETDAAGYFTSFMIGGVSPEGLTDDQPPVIELFMNDANFISGGITNPDPDIYVRLMDDNGINVSGTGVGHDIEATLDGDDKNSFILNDFYQAVLDNYRSGEVRYPLSNLSPGLHTLKVTAWDLANNPGEAYIEFLVVDHEDAILQNVFNYPNPFSNSTTFQFEHNRPGVEMDLQLHIYSLDGRLVKIIERESFISDGFRVADLEWDGFDDGGNQAGPGIYVYKISIAYHLNGQTDIVESKAEKLVIIR